MSNASRRSCAISGRSGGRGASPSTSTRSMKARATAAARSRRAAEMAARLRTADADFEVRFAALLAAKREQSEDVDLAAREILRGVRERGDAALIGYTSR